METKLIVLCNYGSIDKLVFLANCEKWYKVQKESFRGVTIKFVGKKERKIRNIRKSVRVNGSNGIQGDETIRLRRLDAASLTRLQLTASTNSHTVACEPSVRCRSSIRVERVIFFLKIILYTFVASSRGIPIRT